MCLTAVNIKNPHIIFDLTSTKISKFDTSFALLIEATYPAETEISIYHNTSHISKDKNIN
jgi:hypothetical protein